MIRFPAGLLFLLFLNFSPSCPAQRAQVVPVSEKHPEFAEKIHIDGVKDAGKLNDHFYRGSQPNAEGLRSLKKLGVTMIVDLRGEFRRESAHEKREAESLGMKFVLIPGNGWSPPTDKQMAEFFSIISKRGEQKTFIHCWLGGDRTGVFIAAYRIAFQHWTPQEAIQEMHAFHFKSFWHPAMKKYVREFPQRLATSPTLAPYRHLPKSTVALLGTLHSLWPLESASQPTFLALW
jgi:tyrosine-protein phosphatase SIW14